MHLIRPTATAALVWGFLVVVPNGGASDDSPKPTAALVVAGTEQDLDETPMIVEVDPLQLSPGHYRLQAPGDDSRLPALAYRDVDRTYLGFILPTVAARSLTRYAITPAPHGEGAAAGITFAAQGQRIAVTTAGKPWTTYVPDDGPKPYFDPLIGPTDVSLTRSWPMRTVPGEPHDHPHHRSLWFAHFDVNKTDTWDENPGHGQIRETSRPTVVSGGPVGVLRTTDDWLDRTGQKVCEDERVVHFYATQSARVFDFAVTLKATAGPLKIADNKDGVFAIRLAAPMALTANQGGQIVNSRGVVGKAAWGQVAEWVDYTGPVGGETLGVAILNHPSSFRYPTTWHVRDYGLFAANPFGWHDFGQPSSGDHQMAPGESIRLAYRVILHRGATEPARVAARFSSYAKPPQVTFPKP